MERQTEPRAQECVYVIAPGIQLLRRLVQQDNVIDVADVMRRPQVVLYILVDVIEMDVGEELARQVAARQPLLAVLPEKALGVGPPRQLPPRGLLLHLA